MKIDGDNVIFSSGRYKYANRGIIGLSEPDEDGWSISEGYDGGFWAKSYSKYSTDKLSKDDLRELADYMVDLWTRFNTSLDQ